MLVSHRKRFIFTKTSKTAGTSVEAYFEKYCVAPGTWEAVHYRPEHVSDDGIVGARGPFAKGATWYNHMSAARIRDLVGPDIWRDYFKFTVVRDPFDKMVSMFYFAEAEKRAGRRVGFYRRTLDRLRLRHASPTLGDDIARFRKWVTKRGNPDRDRYMIDGRLCLDDFILFERLHDDIARICERLDIPHEPSRLPGFKTGIRRDGATTAQFYDRRTADIVADAYAWEIERFGYRRPV